MNANNQQNSPYKRDTKSQALNASVNMIAQAIANFVAHTLLRKKRNTQPISMSESEKQQLTENLTEQIQELETQRIAVEKETHFVRKVMIPAIIVLFTLSTPWLLLGAPMLATLIIAIIYSKWVYPPYNQYAQEFKKTFIPKIANSLGKFEYQQYGYIAMERVTPSHIIPEYNRGTYQEDYFKGHYKNTKVELVETELLKRGNKSDTTIFDGLMILLTMDKPFTSKTIVRANWGLLNILRKVTLPGKQAVKLDNDEFEKKFDAFSNDPTEAHHLLTPDFLQRLVKISDIYNHSRVEASFYDSQLLILVHKTEDFLAPPALTTPVNELPAIALMYSEFKAVCDIVDALEIQHTL